MCDLCCGAVTPPGQRVQFILGEAGGEDPERCSHPLFSEMEELVLGEGDIPEWKETARYRQILSYFRTNRGYARR